MRINEKEHIGIVDAIKSVTPDAKVYLYGSRVDDSKKGGDIDLLVLLPSLDGLDVFRLKLKMHLELETRLGERRIDLSVTSPSEMEKDAFINSIWNKALLLNKGP